MVYDIEFLRIIYILSKGDLSAKIKITSIAKALDISPSTATERIQRMAKRGLVMYETRKGVGLSENGLRVLTKTVWKEALLEILLVRAGVPLGEACKDARLMALGFSDSAAKVLCQALGHPKYCPHGLRIPHPELGEVLGGNIKYCGVAILLQGTK